MKHLLWKPKLTWGFPKIRSTFGGPYNKDYSIWGSKFGVPPFWETTTSPPERNQVSKPIAHDSQSHVL